MTLGSRLWAFGAYTLGVAALNTDVVLALARHSRHDMTASHLLLMPVVACVLTYQGRREIFRAVETAVWPGLATVLAGVALVVWARVGGGSGDDVLSLAVTGLVVLWAGGFLLWFGGRATGAAAFPLLFLALTVPIPHVVLDRAVAVLKAGSTGAAATLFTLTGTPYFRDGFVFDLPGVSIEVADACSGIRSSIALVLTGLLAGQTALRGWASRTALLLLVLPVTILKNGIRIVTLSLLSIHVDPGYLEGQLHHEGGIVFFLLALALMTPALVVLRRMERGTGRRGKPDGPVPAAGTVTTPT